MAILQGFCTGKGILLYKDIDTSQHVILAQPMWLIVCMAVPLIQFLIVL